MLNKKQNNELITAIKSKKEIPLKFSYIWKWANEWDKIAKKRNSIKTWLNNIEFNLMKKKLKIFLSHFNKKNKINIIDIGCGNSEPSIQILNNLNSKKDTNYRYIPIDISYEMLKLAKNNILKIHPWIEIKTIKIDFEKWKFSNILKKIKEWWYSNLLLFLWSTLGNISDKQKFLINLKKSMSPNDHLIIGIELINFSKIDKILPHYSEKNVWNIQYIIPKKIWIKKENTSFKASWNKKLSQIENKIEILKNTKVKIGKEKFIIKKWESILLMKSTKFSEYTINKLLSDTGFNIKVSTMTNDKSYLITMVQPINNII